MESYLDLIDMTKLSPRQRARFELDVERDTAMSRAALEELARRVSGAGLMKDAPLSDYTRLRVGGPADALIIAHTREVLKEALIFAEERNVPCFIMGTASSFIVRDGGVRGMVITLGPAFADIAISHEQGEEVYIRAGAAARAADVARFAAERGFSGAEACAEWDGTLAGAVVAESSRGAALVTEVTVIDRTGREMTIVPRESRGEDTLRIPRGACLVSLLIGLRKGATPSSAETSSAGRANECPPLLAADHDLNCPSPLAGEGRERGHSFSPSPRLPHQGGGEAEPPRHGAGNYLIEARVRGIFKDVGRQGAATIIADAGLAGVRVGKMRVDPRDANCFVNEGGAKAKAALILMNLIRERVRELTGLTLETAVKIVGED